MKARGVKQGFKENISVTDGPNFNYYSHVAKMLSVRTLLMRRRRRGRRIAIKDIATAFLQSHKYPPGAPRKYICFKHPITNEVMHYRQHAPIYDENSAPVHWEGTLFPFLTDGKKDGVQIEEAFLNFERGDNEPCALYLKERDLVVLVYVDDILADGAEEDIKWFFDKLATRFDCKDDEWLTPDNPLDFLGMDISMDDDNIYMSMQTYVEKMLNAMGMSEVSSVATPINAEIENLTPLPEHLHKLFMTGVGCVGWCVNTVRLDAAFAHSRIAQHMANPTVGAWDALMHLMKYFRGTAKACIWQSLDTPDSTQAGGFIVIPILQETMLTKTSADRKMVM